MGENAGSLRDRFFGGSTFSDLLARPGDNGGLWAMIYRVAKLTPDAARRAGNLRGHWHILVISEDWCGDSVSVLPYIARLEECCDNIDMRIIGRDANRDLMDAHLTGLSRSIPVAIVYDEEFRERGWWGPRPGPLQRWVMSEGLALPKPDRYRHMRAWYARDRGQTVVAELIDIMEGLDDSDTSPAR
ncbi:MAG: thioredoxin family protein [Gemmatimonadaceae bacterium]